MGYSSNVYLFPMDSFITSESSITSPEFEVTRLETLNTIINSNNKSIIITNLMGFLRYLPTKGKYINSIVNLKVNDEINKDELYRNLCRNGYKVETLVSKTGEISSRGFVIDIFPINEDNAIRIEFFGDMIESIRYFDVNTQLSIKKIDNIVITPFSEFLVDVDVDYGERKQRNLDRYGKVSSIIEYLNNPILIYKEYAGIYNSYLLLQEEIMNYNISLDCNQKYMRDLEEFNEKCEIYISSVDDILPNIRITDTHSYVSHEIVNYDDNIELIFF